MTDNVPRIEVSQSQTLNKIVGKGRSYQSPASIAARKGTPKPTLSPMMSLSLDPLVLPLLPLPFPAVFPVDVADAMAAVLVGGGGGGGGGTYDVGVPDIASNLCDFEPKGIPVTRAETPFVGNVTVDPDSTARTEVTTAE
ncbi:hypothetical protein EIK77_001695 [Talaromyces pinophilus]|nr:hypothetical protein EIK77_001695 [Talaromyces pinophilus]